LSGAFVVDDPAAAAIPDRVFVINIVSLRATPIMAEHEILTINGLAWPHTERISARVGEPVHWRVVNSTPSEHPDAPARRVLHRDRRRHLGAVHPVCA
jgi:hypothetical protein